MEDSQYPIPHKTHLKTGKRIRTRCIGAFSIILNVTIVLYQLSEVPEKQKSPQDVFRQVCPRRRLQPTVQSHSLFHISEKFLTEQELKDLQTFLSKENPIISKQLLDAGFVHNYVAFTFNDRGWSQLQNGKLTSPIARFLPLIEKLRHPQANLLKIQVNHMRPRGQGLEGEAGTRRIHFDQTVIQNGTNSCRVTAIKTCILYVTIPKDMIGGNIALFRGGVDTRIEMADKQIAMAVITPITNMLITLRGGTPHKVDDFDSEELGQRRSIVLEQFLVPRDLLAYSADFFEYRPW